MDLTNLNSELLDELREKIALGCRILGKMEIAPDYLGHISCRVPGTDYVLIKGRGKVKDGDDWYYTFDEDDLIKTTTEKVVLVDLNGSRLEDGNTYPPDEVVLHTEVYKKRPDVQSVIHTHQLYATAFGCAGKRILPMHCLMAKTVARELPVYESSRKIVFPKQGEEVAEVLGDHLACHLKNHGMVIVGTSIEEAVIYSVLIEHQAKMQTLASTIGIPSPISDEEIGLVSKEAAPLKGRWIYYVGLLDDKNVRV
jgi:ribulose-5-phosphate 4-epimerase/fuculose-1-phosphate aldolase